MMIAALFVATGGPYFGLPDIDPWDEQRDARRYQGPYPIIGHPPCKRYNRYWNGGPSAKTPRKLGDDDGCFASCQDSAKRWGGVIEHPAASHAWRLFGISRPMRGLWLKSECGGWTTEVDQGRYGHPAKKATWLVVYGCGRLPDLDWTPAKGIRLEDGFHSTAERRAARAAGIPPTKRLSERQRIYTPEPFRDLLIAIAKECGPRE